MHYLFKSEFTINWATLASLLVGIVMGAILFVLIYTLITVIKVKNSTYIVSDAIKEVTIEEINQEINKAQKEFLIKRDEDKGIKWDNIRSITINLIRSIAKKFYPNSIEPIAELTLEEVILLDHYIISKIEAILDKHGLKLFKKLKLTTIIKMINTKNTIDDNKVVKGIKKTGISRILSGAYTILNAINPAMWFKKLIISPSMNLIIKHICLNMISTIGRETYHVYSKQAFLEPINDKEIEKLLKELNVQEDEENVVKLK